MATWVNNLVLLPFAFWLVYCIFRRAAAGSDCSYCRSLWLPALGGLGSWLLVSGLSADIAIRIATGVTLLFVVIVVQGAFFLAARKRRRSESEKQRQASDTDAAVAGAVVGTAALGTAGPNRKPDGSHEIESNDGGSDLGDIGIDV